MIVLGYSGLDGSVRYNKKSNDLRPGEERIVQGLDSAAAILVDGRTVAACAEERFTFCKHTNLFPINSIHYCLKKAGITIEQVDRIAHGFNYGRVANLFNLLDKNYYTSVLAPERQLELLEQKLNMRLPQKKFISVNVE